MELRMADGVWCGVIMGRRFGAMVLVCRVVAGVVWIVVDCAVAAVSGATA